VELVYVQGREIVWKLGFGARSRARVWYRDSRDLVKASEINGEFYR